MTDELVFSEFVTGDEPGLFAIYAAAVEAGGSFPRRSPVGIATFRSGWLTNARTVQVAYLGSRLVGSYFVRPAFPEAAGHIANAGYVVADDLRRRGFGRALAEHSLDTARALGFDAMLFTLVLEHNPSRRLWVSLSFQEVGCIPNAVDGQNGYLYWRSLAVKDP
jgi:L-amino acid N-acyltransferase YncA